MFNPSAYPHLQTPAYILDEAALVRNLEKAQRVRQGAGVKIVLATKAFALFNAFSVMRDYLDGTTASGLYEARLGHEEFGKEVHVYAPAFEAAEIDDLIPIATHISFNSPPQFHTYRAKIKAVRPTLSLGMRINPELKLAQKEGFDQYNPCAPCSRMGTLWNQVDDATREQLEGLHFHVLCEKMAKDSVALIDLVEKDYAPWLRKMKWVNLGGGHFLNHPDYDVDVLTKRLQEFRQSFPNLEVILEPGGGLVYDTGYLVATVLDIIENVKPIAVLDASATAHMPDVLLIPYRPPVQNSGEAGEKKYSYLLGSKSCMTGDVMGEYSFDTPLHRGDRIVFTEMMQYTMVQQTNFNGIRQPDIGILHRDGTYEIVRRFGYEDFKNRLGGKK